MGNSLALIFKLIFWDILVDILYFPVWWYTQGLARAGRNSWQKIKYAEATLGVWLWIRNIFVPMFGQRDAAGVIISFIMRVLQIIGRGLILLLISVFEIILLVLWIVLPVFIASEIFYHLKFFIY